jgi:chromosomal replication initiator protein
MHIWQSFVKEQLKKIGTNNQQWLSFFKVSYFNARNLYLEAKTPFHLLWFEEHIKPHFDQFVRSQNHRPIKVHLELAQQLADKKPKTYLSRLEEETLLHPQMTFDQWIETKENAFCIEMAKRYLNEKQYPCLFIEGPKDAGKTHLLQALAHLAKDKCRHPIFVDTNTFSHHFVTAIRLGQMEHFRHFYRKADFLAFDNVQDFENKSTTQEEFFHLFNHLHLNNTPMIFSNKGPLHLISGIEPRILSRFQWGLQLKLRLLNMNDLKKMMQQRASTLNLKISPSFLEHLLHLASYSQIRKAFDLVLYRAHVHKLNEIDLNQGLSLIEDFSNKQLTLEEIVDQVCHYYDIKKIELLSKSKVQKFVFPRKIAMFLCRHELNLPYTVLKKYFQKDHSTIISSVKAIKNIHDKNILTDLEKIRAQL